MSMIPTAAVAGELIPVQRSTNELLRARQVQFQKNAHHSEDVEALDETTVNSVRDQNQRQGGQADENNANQGGERVEIEALRENGPPPQSSLPDESPPRLDISA